jgi:hypothetical protein
VVPDLLVHTRAARRPLPPGAHRRLHDRWHPDRQPQAGRRHPHVGPAAHHRGASRRRTTMRSPRLRTAP